MKTAFTWADWKLARVSKRAVSDRINPAECRRKASSSDQRLAAVFQGKRGLPFEALAPSQDSSASHSAVPT